MFSGPLSALELTFGKQNSIMYRSADTNFPLFSPSIIFKDVVQIQGIYFFTFSSFCLINRLTMMLSVGKKIYHDRWF